jgi:hypothetical protein
LPTGFPNQSVTVTKKYQQNTKRWKYNHIPSHQKRPNGNGCAGTGSTLETMVSRREKVAVDGTKISSRYEGVPEHGSHIRYSYPCLLTLMPERYEETR